MQLSVLNITYIAVRQTKIKTGPFLSNLLKHQKIKAYVKDN